VGDSAVIVPIDLPPELERLRNTHDPMAALGVPPHVTLLFPFVPPDRLTPDIRSQLESLVALEPRFQARFSTIERRGGMVWLLPDDEGPFLRLTSALAERWSDHPPYGGKHPDLVAHLTLLASADDDALDRARASATSGVPFEMSVREVSLIVEGDQGRWEERWRFPLADSRI
jgi:2'-5' RNA ligase